MNLDDILELEFQMTYSLNIPFDYNDMEYYEFVWRFERLVTERKRENEAQEMANGRMSLANLGANISNMNSMDVK